jgi:hypothetical protein
MAIQLSRENEPFKAAVESVGPIVEVIRKYGLEGQLAGFPKSFLGKNEIKVEMARKSVSFSPNYLKYFKILTKPIIENNFDITYKFLSR